MDSPDRPRVALIAGPTASGKSAIALRLAEAIGGTIINADATQVYRDLRVLSARPSAEEEARATHRLFGYRDGICAYSAAEWASDAKAEIAAALGRNAPPILVGGSGLYLRTLIDGIAPLPEIASDVRNDVRALDTAEAYAALAREDPAGAARLRPSDATRIKRALEVVRSTGRPLSDWQSARSGGIGEGVEIVPLVLLPPRDWLRDRIATRFEAMLEQGAIEEVEALRARGLDPGLPVMRAIGVRAIDAWLSGSVDRATMLRNAIDASRQYAKRQYTWFRHQLAPSWPRVVTQLDEAGLVRHARMLRTAMLTR